MRLCEKHPVEPDMKKMTI